MLDQWLNLETWVGLWNTSNIFRWITVFVVAMTVWSWMPQMKFGLLKAVPLKQQELPPEVLAFFDSQDTPLHRAGFSPAGDYQTVHGKHPNYARFYTCHQQDVFVEVNCYHRHNGLFGKKYCRCLTCVSVFEDGTCWQTGTISLFDNGASAPPQLILRGQPKLKIDELIAVHRNDVVQYSHEHQTGILQYPPDELADVSIYYAQYQREFFVKKGELTPPHGYEETKTRVAGVNAESYAEINA